MQCCKTCLWLEVPPDAVGRRVVRKEHGYRCVWPELDLVLPDSVTKMYGFGARQRTRMTGDDGQSCPTYDAMETA
jgi:hypothetical protein